MDNKIEEFRKSIDEAISLAGKGIANKMDVHLLEDVKRMSELGVLTIETRQPKFKPFNPMDTSLDHSLEVEIQCRLRFIGEETIKELSKELKEAKELLKELHNETLYRVSKDDVRTQRPSCNLFDRIDKFLTIK